MVWVSDPPHRRMWHERSCTTRRLPSDVVIPTTPSVPSCSKPVKDEPCGGADAPSLTAPARAGLLTEWVGARKRAFQVEQGNCAWCKLIGPGARALTKYAP